MNSAGKKTILVFVVDTFSDKPFHGSQCPVCVVPWDMVLDERTMGNIAIEMNMAEVAFLRPLHKDDHLETAEKVGLRWFNPAREVKLCGHGSFATAAILFYRFGNKNRYVTCETRYSGDLVLKQDGDVIRVDFPLGVTVRQTATEHDNFIKSLGTAIPEVQDVCLCPALGYLLVRLRDGWSRQQFEDWRCDMRLMEHAVSTSSVIVVIVTIAGDRRQGYVDGEGRAYDFISRVFVPSSEARPEDPVTGSAQTVLAHYWSQEMGKDDLYTRQCSHRGGEVVMEVDGSRVHLTTLATVVIEGTLRI